MRVFNTGVQTEENELNNTKESLSTRMLCDVLESHFKRSEKQSNNKDYDETHRYYHYCRKSWKPRVSQFHAYNCEETNQFDEKDSDEIVYDNEYLICEASWLHDSTSYSDCEEMNNKMVKITLDDNCYHSEVDSGVISGSQSYEQPHSNIIARNSKTSPDMTFHFDVQSKSNPPTPTSTVDKTKPCFRRAVPRMGTQLQRNIKKDSVSQLQGRGLSPAGCQSSTRCVEMPPNNATTLKAPVELVGASMEWVLKKRADGTRYVTRRPARNRILNNEHEHVCQVDTERATICTNEVAAATFSHRKRHRRKIAPLPISASRSGATFRPRYLLTNSKNQCTSSSSSDSSKQRGSPASSTHHRHNHRSTSVRRSAVCFYD